MRSLAILSTALLFGVAFAADDKDADKKKDMTAMDGEWSMVSGEANGMKLDDERVKTAKRIVKDGITTVKFGDTVAMAAKFTLDPGKKPKTIDYSVTEGPNKDKTVLGIYELDGDTAKFCFAQPGEEPPKEFASKEGSNHIYSTWKRDKKAEKKEK